MEAGMMARTLVVYCFLSKYIDDGTDQDKEIEVG